MDFCKSFPREYSAWSAAKTRCYNPRYHNFKHYGGRGIYMAECWRLNFRQFVADMGNCPKGCSLDRIDNDGPYSPENCRWATPHQQHANTRANRFFEFNGHKLTVSEWARRTGIKKTTIWARIDGKWPIDLVFTKPVQVHRRHAEQQASTQ